MATEAQALHHETSRLYDELAAAREPYLAGLADGTLDSFTKARHDTAQAAVVAHRRLWRQIGQYTGDRPVGPDGEDVHSVAVANNQTAAPATLTGKA